MSSSSSRDTSPDPITLPSSPLGQNIRSARKTPHKQFLRTRAKSPSKSLVLDTPNGAGGESPWRIRVTVEAEPSPAKVPLKVEEGKTGRKRKGTPIRRGRSTRHQPPKSAVEEIEGDMGVGGDEMPPPPRPSEMKRRISRLNAPTLRSQRLSLAREELDIALQEAVGEDRELGKSMRFAEQDFSRSVFGKSMRVAGEETLSRNEDFSMVSVETLLTGKEGNSSGLGDSRGFMPSSPPKRGSLRRSVLGQPLEFGRNSALGNSTAGRSALGSPFDIDNPRQDGANAMNWNPTGPARELTPSSQLKPDVVLRRSRTYGMDGANDQAIDLDIWQDEASRSMEEQHPQEEDPLQLDHHPQAQQREEEDEETYEAQLQSDAAAQSRSPGLEDIFADQPLRPARAKIPRTWRRSSGMDFEYVDSPAHEPVEVQQEEGNVETEAEAEGSGVLTPPSTSDEMEEEEEEAQSEWNQPDAEATRYETHNQAIAQDREEEEDDEDTGTFFQQNMPQVHARQQQAVRPRRPRPPPRPEGATVDLTDLLGLKSSPVKPKPISPAVVASSSRSAQLHGSAFDGKMKLNPSQGGKAKVVDSPLRRSLLKSSKVHGGSPEKASRHSSSPQTSRGGAGHPVPELRKYAVPAAEVHRPPPRTQRQELHQPPLPAPGMKTLNLPPTTQRAQARHETESTLSPAILDRSQTTFPNTSSRVESDLYSFASKTSDQRQLLGEMTPRIGTGLQQEQSYSEVGASSPAPVMRSYEEHLNVDSPRKVPVRFGDSSSVLPPTKLFLSQAGRRQGQKPTLAPKPVPLNVPPADGKKPMGLWGMLSGMVWSAVSGPTGPTEIFPPEHKPQHHHETSENSFTDEELGMEMFNTTLRTAIRNRYGVLPSTLPWTMAHMRTLHRMLNSLISGRADSLIPNAGPLPNFLEDILDTQQETVTGRRFLFTREHAYVVFSFLQILVEEEVVRELEGELGDAVSRAFRGEVEGDVRGRRGGDQVFRRREGSWREEGEIGWGFVVGALGCAVRSNEVSEGRA